MAASFPQSQDLRENKEEVLTPYDLVLAVARCHFCSICSLEENQPTNPHSWGEELLPIFERSIEEFVD